MRSAPQPPAPALPGDTDLTAEARLQPISDVSPSNDNSRPSQINRATEHGVASQVANTISENVEHLPVHDSTVLKSSSQGVAATEFQPTSTSPLPENQVLSFVVCT